MPPPRRRAHAVRRRSLRTRPLARAALRAASNSARLIDAVAVGVEPVEHRAAVGMRAAATRSARSPERLASARLGGLGFLGLGDGAVAVGVEPLEHASRTCAADFGAGDATLRPSAACQATWTFGAAGAGAGLRDRRRDRDHAAALRRAIRRYLLMRQLPRRIPRAIARRPSCIALEWRLDASGHGRAMAESDQARRARFFGRARHQRHPQMAAADLRAAKW